MDKKVWYENMSAIIFCWRGSARQIAWRQQLLTEIINSSPAAGCNGDEKTIF